MEEFQVKKILQVVEVSQILVHVTHGVIKRPCIIDYPSTRMPDIFFHFTRIKRLKFGKAFRDHGFLVVVGEFVEDGGVLAGDVACLEFEEVEEVVA